MNSTLLLKLTQPSNFVADKVFECTDWKGNTTTCYSKKVGGTTYTTDSLITLEAKCKAHVEYTDNGARHYYDGKTFNND